MMYNFSVVSGGIDLDSDLILDIAKTARNIFGVKLSQESMFEGSDNC